MAGDPKAKAKRALRAAQKQFEREKEAANRTRREAFSQAQREGLTLREIAAEVGLHHSRISQIIEGK
jgi:DNA-directed RNA polymerase specialized sigma24 family protein